MLNIAGLASKNTNRHRRSAFRLLVQALNDSLSENEGPGSAARGGELFRARQDRPTHVPLNLGLHAIQNPAAAQHLSCFLERRVAVAGQIGRGHQVNPFRVCEGSLYALAGDLPIGRYIGINCFCCNAPKQPFCNEAGKILKHLHANDILVDERVWWRIGTGCRSPSPADCEGQVKRCGTGWPWKPVRARWLTWLHAAL